MKQFLRRLRGVIKTGLMWAVGWAGSIFVIAPADEQRTTRTLTHTRWCDARFYARVTADTLLSHLPCIIEIDLLIGTRFHTEPSTCANFFIPQHDAIVSFVDSAHRASFLANRS